MKNARQESDRILNLIAIGMGALGLYFAGRFALYLLELIDRLPSI